MRKTSIILMLGLGVCACGKEIEGPAPVVVGVSPPAVCQAQVSTTVALTGQGLSPLYTGALDKGKLELPAVSLGRVMDVAGAPVAMSTSIAIPDDPNTPAQSYVRWTSQTAMSFDVFPGLLLPTGLYDIHVANANGKTGTFPASLLAVPPPTVTRIEADLACNGKDNSFTLTGDFFIRTATTMPSVKAGDLVLAPVAMTACRNLPGTGGFQACTQMTIAVPKAALAPGVVLVQVTNPGPVGCSSIEQVSLTLVPEPVVTSFVPDLGCAAEGAVLVKVQGTGFLTVDGAAPTVTVGTATVPSTASGCTTITGVRETAQTCTELQIAIPVGTAAGQPDVVVTNPAPADCTSAPTKPVTLFDRPVVALAVPDLTCAADGAVTLKIQGTGFVTVDAATPAVTVGGVALTSTATGCTAVTGPREVTTLCTELSIELPAGATPGQPDVVVTNPAPVGCSSLPTRPVTLFDRPVVASVVPAEACAADGARPVAIKGSGFLSVAGQTPTVQVGPLTLPSTVAGCTDVAGPSEAVRLCTDLAITVPTTAPAGEHAVRVTNPAPAACISALGPTLTVFDRPVIASVTPLSVCGNAATATVVIAGTSFITQGATLPSVMIGSQTYVPTVSGCTAVGAPAAAIRTCTGLSVAVAPSSLTRGKLPVVVTNPAGIGCASTGTSTLEVSPPPVLVSVSPATVCAGAASVTLTGTSFASAAVVTINGVPASGVKVSADGTTATADFSTLLTAGGPYDVTISNGAGCSSTKTAAITVVNGPQLYFCDPPVAYNGISIQSTLYGSGFTGAVQGVSIQTSGGTPIPLTFTQDPANPSRVQAVIPKNTPAGTYDIQLRDTTACPAMVTAGLRVTDTTSVTLATPAIRPPFGWKDGTTAASVVATAAATGFVAVPRLYLNPQNPGPGTVATAVGAVAFVDKTELSVLFPKNLPLGAYDLIVVNPDGTVGVAQASFTVMANPAPHIEAVSPGSVANQAGQAVTITGTNFRTPSTTLSCVDANGAALATSPTATGSNATATSLTMTFDASAAGVACVVRVTNSDTTYGDFSALVITNPAQNLYPAKLGPDLATARRAPVALAGNASNAARYLHVLGGDGGSGAALDTVETSPLGLLGVPAPFFAQRNKLKQARAFAGGATIGRFLYIAGGSSAGTPQSSVERAYVLDPDQRGEITNLALELDTTAGVGPGTWYYRVAPIMAGTDAFNPNGENLPSDPFPVQLPNLGTKKLDVTIVWQASTGASKYRVYRSPAAGAAVGAEQVIAEVNAPATSYTDKGGAPINTDTPLPIGSLGVWQTLAAALATPREGAGVAWAMDPADATKAYLYVLGGRQNATTALASFELLPITLGAGGAQTPAATFTDGTEALGAARWQLGASRGIHDLTPRIPAGSSYVYALSGVAANGTSIVNRAEAALVQAGGQLAAFTDLGNNLNRAGYGMMVAGNFVFAFGGGNGVPDTSVVSGEICGPGVNACGPVPRQIPPGIVNWNAGQTMQVARYLMGSALSGAYFYLAGGITAAGTPPTLTRSTEYRLW